MKPTSLLTDRDYERLLDELLKSPSPSDFLNACEADYLPVNQSFYGLLLNAIRREIGKRMSELNAFLCLPANKGFDYEEARQIFIDPKLEETKVLVEGRAQAFAKKNDWRPAFKERLLAFLLSETERKLKKDSDMFSKEIPLEKEVGAVARKAYLDAEMQRINSDSAYKAFRILRAETGDLEDFLLLEIHKRISFIREEPGHIYDAANQIEVGKNYSVYLEGLKTVNRLRILQDAMSRQKNRLPKEAKKDAALPSLGDVVKDAVIFLPKLWGALAEMTPPVFTPEGEFVWTGKRGKAAVLVALADALEYRGKLAAGVKGEEAYLVLCKHFGHEPAKRPDKVRANGKRVYGEYWKDFHLLINGL